MPEPSSKKGIRQFLGVLTFYRSYVPQFSELAFPLTELTKKDRPNIVRFNEKERAAFIKLKQALCDATVLYVPDSTKPFVLRTDASDLSGSAACSQLDSDGLERPVGFFSVKFSPTQRRYSVSEREALAVLLALRKWDYLLYGTQIQLFSDHNPLVFVHAGTASSSKLTRWALALSRYNITFKHIAGRDNIVADVLSRV
jgi:hypothetical protein